jgi:hypothetical protein
MINREAADWGDRHLPTGWSFFAAILAIFMFGEIMLIAQW